MSDPSRDRGDPLERAWQPLRSTEPPESLYQAMRQGIRETPQRPGQARIARSLGALAAVLGVAAIVVGGALWSARPVGPGTAPPASQPGTAPPALILSAPVPGKLWSFKGQQVPWNVLSLAKGPGHCGWENVLFLGMNSRLGEPTMSSDDLMEYVRDPSNAWATASDRPDAPRTLGRFEPSVPEPADAVFTGYVYHDGMELWRSEAATDDVAFLRRGDVWERWPRSAEPIACM